MNRIRVLVFQPFILHNTIEVSPGLDYKNGEFAHLTGSSGSIIFSDSLLALRSFARKNTRLYLSSHSRLHDPGFNAKILMFNFC